MRNILLSLFTIFFLHNSLGADRLKPLLQELDQAVSQANVYDSCKMQRLDELKVKLKERLGNEKMHEAYLQLYKEYETFTVDSALYYAKAHLDFSEKQNDVYWINECKMQQAKIYAVFARFPESLELLCSIERDSLPAQQLGAYFGCFEKMYRQWEECAADKELENKALKEVYRDSLLTVLSRGMYDYDLVFGRKCIESKDFFRAQEILTAQLTQLNPETPESAMTNLLIAYLYEMRGDRETRLEYLAKSAIAGVKASAKENPALRLLALYLVNEGKEGRSGIYINRCMEDAHFYSAHLNNAQIAHILPVIDKSSQLEKTRHVESRKILIFVICILIIILIYAVSYAVKHAGNVKIERKEVEELRKELEKTSRELSEANQIKEEYIKRFILQCAEDTHKLINYRGELVKKAEARKVEELYAILRSTKMIETEWKEFYQNFDTAFLILFPNFVEEFNKLFPAGEQVALKQENILNPELRIYALIRLGVTNSAKIAAYLDYSTTTVYNYRAMIGGKSLLPRNDFEEAVAKIGCEVIFKE
ncbi:MAG: DUF6377 domain-containing protein [Candidatus Symbiothrix sp.]|jgi:hypothetical protein|nr:DUF6377 domain-containing protein [Candidatus Symbiothrix sp.]